MTGFILRIIAMVTMLTDHVGSRFLDNSMALRSIGRIAFPIYAFLLAEGFLIFYKKKDRVIKHLSMLISLVVLTEFCYDLFECGLDFENYMTTQNNIITLLLGFLGMALTEALFPMNEKKYDHKFNKWFVLISTYFMLGVTNLMVKSNYNMIGPWLVIAFYWFLRLSRDHKTNENIWGYWKRFGFLVLIFAIYLPLYFWFKKDFCDFSTWLDTMNHYIPWIIGHLGVIIILSFANGKLGYTSKWFKWIYISFYPVHLLILGLIGLVV